MLLIDEKKKPCIKRFVAIHTLRRRRMSGECVERVRGLAAIDKSKMDNLFNLTFPPTVPVTLVA